MTRQDFDPLSKKKPERRLLGKVTKRSGRDNKGRVSVRHRGGGHKRRYRLVDFKRAKEGMKAKVAAIEYDPNRSAHLALVQYEDGEKRYILWPQGLKVGDRIEAGEGAEIRTGNCLPLEKIPVGTQVHNVELVPGRGGQICRSAGTFAQLMGEEKGYMHLRMPSGEIRLVHNACRATIGVVGNVEHENVRAGKAGRKRWLGHRPTVRGVVMNACDHPHGGGEGRSTAGHVLTTPWGQPTKGYRTRRQKRSDRFIVRRRKRR